MPRPQRPSAPRLFYYIHHDTFIIDNLVHMKAELNTALRVESDPAEYLKMQNYIRGTEKRMLELNADRDMWMALLRKPDHGVKMKTD